MEATSLGRAGTLDLGLDCAGLGSLRASEHGILGLWKPPG